MMNISSIVSYNRVHRHSRISGTKRTYTTFKSESTYEPITARNECDTHADTCCAGRNWTLIELTDIECNVKGFSNELGVLNKIPVATVGTLWVNPDDGSTYILVMHEVLYFGDALEHSLINPNQIRMYLGDVVEDNPLSNKSLGISIDKQEMLIPFQTSGITIYWESTKPSPDDLDKYTWIVLTDSEPWVPGAVELCPNITSDKTSILDNREVFQTIVSSRYDHDEFESDLILQSNFRMTEQLLYQRMISQVTTATSLAEVRSNDRHSKHTPEHISKVFDITLDKAKDMLSKTTQQTIRMGVTPLTRRYRSFSIDPNENRVAGQWVIDYLESSIKSIRQNVGAFVITNGKYIYVLCTPKQTDEYATRAITMFSADVGVPTEIKSDLHSSFTGKHTQFQQFLRSKHIVMTNSESGRHGHTYKVDTAIREIRRRSRKKMISKNVPRRLWCLMLEWQARIMQLIPHGYNERTGYEIVTGKTPDISEYCDFDFYDLVWYWPNTTASHSDTNRQLARWVGVAHRIGSTMCYWLIPESGSLIANTSVQHVIRDDYMNPEIKQLIDQFNTNLADRLDDKNFTINNETTKPLDIYDVDDANDQSWDENDSNEMPEAEDLNDELIDQYIGTTFLLDPIRNHTNVATKVKVLKRNKDFDGKPIGVANKNPLLDTREYICEYPDGTLDTYHANTIAENIWSPCDNEGNEFMSYKEIIDHRKNDKALISDNGFTTIDGISTPKKTTIGWEILVEFTSGETQWLPLKVVKESNPVQLADYAVKNKIDKEPAFNWWVSYTLRKRDRIIKKVKAKYWRTTHKFGIRLPKTVEEALQIDEENGNTLWRDAIEKEMRKAKVSYTAIQDATPQDVRSNKCDDLRGHQEIKCHIIFDVKMDFTRKARFVAGGHMTDTPSSITYSSVVSRESVKIAFLIAALNDLDIMSCDIGNAYLNAPCREKIWFVAGKECGPDLEVKPCKLVRALYGLKSSGAAWRAMFSHFIINTLGFLPTRIDPDVYYRKNCRPNGEAYYEYVLVYVDDVLAISHDPTTIMKGIGEHFTIKDDKYGEPTTYLGANIERIQLDDGSWAWSMTSEHYVKNLIETVSDLLAEDGRELKGTFKQKSHTGPLPVTYAPELDDTRECSEKHASRYRQIIGILRWAVELGRLDIHFEVAMMSQYQASPREGHLEALYLIVHYLKKQPFKRMIFDPRTVKVDETAFNDRADWTEFYGNVVEEDPPGMPTPLGNPVTITCFVDASHATNKVTRRSHTGVMIFLNTAPALSFSKRQNTVESATYGSELVAMRIARDLISALRIKLKSFGIPILGPANVYGDNGAVVKNTSIPESTLNKKHNSINYHIIRESVAARMMRIAKEDSETNIADAFTKLLHTDRKRKLLRFLKDH